MTFLIRTVSKILGVDETEFRLLLISLLDKIDPALTWIRRIVIIGVILYSLIDTPVQAILILILGYFICILENRVDELEEKLDENNHTK